MKHSFKTLTLSLSVLILCLFSNFSYSLESANCVTDFDTSLSQMQELAGNTKGCEYRLDTTDDADVVKFTIGFIERFYDGQWIAFDQSSTLEAKLNARAAKQSFMERRGSEAQWIQSKA